MQTYNKDAEVVENVPRNLIYSFQYLDVTTIRQLNRHYDMHSVEGTVDNLVWSVDRVLSLCENNIHNKIREELIEVSPLEVGGPITF